MLLLASKTDQSFLRMKCDRHKLIMDKFLFDGDQIWL